MASTRDGTCDSAHVGDGNGTDSAGDGHTNDPCWTFRINSLSGMDTGCPENTAGGLRPKVVVAGPLARRLDCLPYRLVRSGRFSNALNTPLGKLERGSHLFSEL